MLSNGVNPWVVLGFSEDASSGISQLKTFLLNDLLVLFSKIKKLHLNQTWHVPVVRILGGLKQDGDKFKVRAIWQVQDQPEPPSKTLVTYQKTKLTARKAFSFCCSLTL